MAEAGEAAAYSAGAVTTRVARGWCNSSSAARARDMTHTISMAPAWKLSEPAWSAITSSVPSAPGFSKHRLPSDAADRVPW